jgi:RND family efflux transporter MFP subunit
MPSSVSRFLKTTAGAKTVLLVVMCSALLCMFSGCTEEAPPPTPPEVTVARPLQQNIRAYHDFIGNMRAIESVDVRARVEGFLEDIHFEDGADVDAGDLLFTIEQEPFEADVAQADAQLESARADLARAEADLKRVEEAARTGAVSEQEVDLRRAQRDIAAAAVNQAQAALTNTELLLGYTKVTSPIDGRTSRRFVDVGNLVGSGEKTLLARVVKLDPMYVYFNISESLLLRILKEAGRTDLQRPKTDVRLYVGLADEDDYAYEGRLDYIDNRVDPETGTVEVRGVFSNEDRLFYPGMFVRIRAPELDETLSLLVHESAVGTDLGGKFVLIVGDKNIIERRYVQLGQLFGQMRAIRKGIRSNESYVVTGIQRARPGLPVTPKEQTPQSPRPGDTQPSKPQPG